MREELGRGSTERVDRSEKLASLILFARITREPHHSHCRAAWPSRPRMDVIERLTILMLSQTHTMVLPCQLVCALLAFSGMEAEPASIKRRTVPMSQRLRFGIFLAPFHKPGSTAAAMTRRGLASITPQALSYPPRRSRSFSGGQA
jgi:hypothetical protein